jgi:6-phospho-beta-glucosidase
MSRLPKLTVLGGSSPFTAALFESMASSSFARQAGTLLLQGRDRGALEVMAACARHRLQPFGWDVQVSTHLPQALEGATYVVHQIRYGGLEGREDGEGICARFDVPADETLGPAALQSAIRSLPGLRATARCIAECCPDAWTLNLTNPLSITTAVMIDAGVGRCVGLCELPETTAGAVARLLGIEPAQLQWDYAGLNHRGFLHHLEVDGRPALPRLLEVLAKRSLPGVTVRDVELLQAVPLKYFALVRMPSRIPPRARAVRDLRDSVLRELKARPDVSPPSLQKRNCDWYEKAVVPLLAALASDGEHTQVVNLAGVDGLIVETRARIGRQRMERVTSLPPSSAVRQWIDAFTAHERAFLDATVSPSEAAIREVLRRDPLVPADRVDRLTSALLESALT